MLQGCSNTYLLRTLRLGPLILPQMLRSKISDGVMHFEYVTAAAVDYILIAETYVPGQLHTGHAILPSSI